MTLFTSRLDFQLSACYGPAFTLTGTGGIVELIESTAYAFVDNYNSKIVIQNNMTTELIEILIFSLFEFMN